MNYYHTKITTTNMEIIENLPLNNFCIPLYVVENKIHITEYADKNGHKEWLSGYVKKNKIPTYLSCYYFKLNIL